MRVKEIDIEALAATLPEIRGYMAGFFDGEGHISIARRGWLKTTRDNSTPMRPVYSLVAGAAQNRKAPLLLFYDLFGGTLRIDTRIRAGKFGKQVIYEWTIGGKIQVPLFLRFLRPHLRVKDKQADIAVEFSRLSTDEVTEQVFEEFQAKMKLARANEAELEHIGDQGHAA
jgi:hypothetical protein